MGKRRKYLLLTVAALVVVGLTLFLATPREPSYDGKRLSEWIKIYGENGLSTSVDKETAAGAIRQIGTNALPYPVKWIGYENATLEMAWCRISLNISPAE